MSEYGECGSDGGDVSGRISRYWHYFYNVDNNIICKCGDWVMLKSADMYHFYIEKRRIEE